MSSPPHNTRIRRAGEGQRKRGRKSGREPSREEGDETERGQRERMGNGADRLGPARLVSAEIASSQVPQVSENWR